MALPIAFQVTMTGSAINLASNAFQNGVSFAAKTGNSAGIAVGNSSSVTTSTGALVPAGQVIPGLQGIGNTNAYWVIGTSGDVLSVLGS